MPRPTFQHAPHLDAPQAAGFADYDDVDYDYDQEYRDAEIDGPGGPEAGKLNVFNDPGALGSRGWDGVLPGAQALMQQAQASSARPLLCSTVRVPAPASLQHVYACQLPLAAPRRCLGRVAR